MSRNVCRAAFVLGVSILLTLAASAAVGWSETGKLNTERAGHAAVTLQSGKVLVSGGCVAWKDNFTAACDLYDPATGLWTATGAMSTPRSEHGLVLLQSGKVLAIGGFYKDGSQEFYLNSCELYDPASGSWSQTGSLAEQRTVFATVLLPSGKVLVAGGLYKNPSAEDIYMDGVEIYDPAAGTWSAAAKLLQSRTAHTGTLLASGKVLVVGGATQGYTPLNTSEEYDPSANVWTAAGNMSSPRAGHTTTRLSNGKLLTAGGAASIFTITGGCEIYDPAARSWSATGSLVKARALHSANLLGNGKVLAAGGGSGFPADVLKNPMADAELYDPGTGAWSAIDPMKYVRSTFATAMLPNGSVLVTGGLYYTSPNYFSWKKCEIYTPTGGGCSLACTASATPASGPAPLAVIFAATATATGCTGAPAYSWTFGDGASSSQQSPSHTYGAAGTYTWNLTATADGQSCTKSGTVVATSSSRKPGDCNGDGTVSIGEVQKAINMFLGLAPPDCGVDCNGDGSVSIGELQKVINGFLGLPASC